MIKLQIPLQSFFPFFAGIANYIIETPAAVETRACCNDKKLAILVSLTINLLKSICIVRVGKPSPESKAERSLRLKFQYIEDVFMF